MASTLRGLPLPTWFATENAQRVPVVAAGAMQDGAGQDTSVRDNDS